MLIDLNRCAPEITEVLGDEALVNLAPKARKHHKFTLELPDGTTHHYYAPTRIGYFGHDEYTLPEGKVIVRTIMYGEQYAYLKK